MAEERRKSPSLLKKLALSAISVFMCVAIFGIGELYCRYFLDINLRKTSKNFVVATSDGRILGNEKNAQGVSFGTEVYSDANGFRIPAGYKTIPSDKAVLVLGDSVAFGVGIPEEETFVGLFRASHPEVAVYNSAVVGYSIGDYRRVASDFLPEHPEVKHIYLFYCLNDFHSESETEAPKAGGPSLVQSLKELIAAVFVNMNESFGSRSKLYVYITGLAIDPSSRYFEWDLSLMNVPDEKFRETAGPIVEIGRFAAERGATFTVFLTPYEKQIRDGRNANFSPQDRIGTYLTENGVKVVDTRARFAGLELSSDAFLFADPMHLSQTGHKLVFGAIEEVWSSNAGVLGQ